MVYLLYTYLQLNYLLRSNHGSVWGAKNRSLSQKERKLHYHHLVEERLLGGYFWLTAGGAKKKLVTTEMVRSHSHGSTPTARWFIMEHLKINPFLGNLKKTARIGGSTKYLAQPSNSNYKTSKLLPQRKLQIREKRTSMVKKTHPTSWKNWKSIIEL